ncbi:MAG: hypothetical protein ACI8YQ_003009 [Polaribacter sp.]|jgi:hypothetical protein
MKVSKITFYYWLKVEQAVVIVSSTVELKQRIKELFELNHKIYGSLRIKEALKRERLLF